ncbi:hypothetical protein I79_026083 [Cricetulus griseus]|uniref:Uncharacterized protein n=1 Tax=Cricetulus griseus TaxID=10029 RepID=G3IPZ8_CRIGR|nr:hypothetical protein I79_026083 [Cricetulus griseus]
MELERTFNIHPMQILPSSCREIPCSSFHRWEPGLGLNASGDGNADLLPDRNEASRRSCQKLH